MRRVLVIDDHEPSRKILIDTLSQDGYQIAGEGATGNTAVALTTTTLPDIVLMAVGLPDAPLEMIRVNYRVTELHGWVIVTPTGKAENNEPSRVKYLFKRWLSEKRPRDCQSVHLWLENMTRIDLGNYSLRIFHRPGHTSGCISIIETTHGLLFSAYSVFAGGTLSYIAQSGHHRRLHRFADPSALLRPTHAVLGARQNSATPMEDIDHAIAKRTKNLSINDGWRSRSSLPEVG